MAEIVIGPKGRMQWDAAKADTVFESTGSWIFRERARNATLEWIDNEKLAALKRYKPRLAAMLKAMNARGIPIGIPIEKQYGTMKHNEGQVIGVRSGVGSPVYHSMRIDWDEEKGPHYNAMVRGGGDTLKACFRFDAPPGQDGDAWVKKMQAKWSR